MPITLNTKRLCQQSRMMLDSANAHLLADKVKHLNAFLYAAMTRGALESALYSMDEDDPAYEQLNKLDAEAVVLCEKFEKIFGLYELKAKEPEPQRKVTVKSKRNEHPEKHDRTRRIPDDVRWAIWNYFQDHKKNYQEYKELAIIYDTSTGTIQRWAENNPGEPQNVE